MKITSACLLLLFLPFFSLAQIKEGDIRGTWELIDIEADYPDTHEILKERMISANLFDKYEIRSDFTFTKYEFDKKETKTGNWWIHPTDQDMSELQLTWHGTVPAREDYLLITYFDDKKMVMEVDAGVLGYRIYTFVKK